MEESLSQSDLVARARQGDATAFTELMNELSSDLHRYASRRLSGERLQARVDADDVIQETRFEIWRNLNLLRNDSAGMFRIWVFSILRRRINRTLRFLLAQARDPRQEVRPDSSINGQVGGRLVDDEPSPSQTLQQQELREQIFCLIGQLSDIQQTVVCLRFVEELTTRGIAERLGMSHGTIQGHLRRALQTLARRGRLELRNVISGISSI